MQSRRPGISSSLSSLGISLANDWRAAATPEATSPRSPPTLPTEGFPISLPTLHIAVAYYSYTQQKFRIEHYGLPHIHNRSNSAVATPTAATQEGYHGVRIAPTRSAVSDNGFWKRAGFGNEGRVGVESVGLSRSAAGIPVCLRLI